MKLRILNLCTALSILLAPALSMTIPAYAACPGSGENSSKGQVLTGVSKAGEQCNPNDVTNAARTVVEVLSIVAGIVGVIMIVFAGFRFITSAGDSGKVASAKTALIYAMVGIAVAALAQVLVQFVLFQTDAATTPPKAKP